MKAERNYKTLILVVVICVSTLIASLSVQSAYAEGFPLGSVASVCADTKLNLRDVPQGEIIGKLPRGETVTTLSKIDRDGYYHIRVNKTGQECYAYGEYLALVQSGNQNNEYDSSLYPDDDVTIELSDFEEGNILFVTSMQQLNMRKRPSRKGNRIKYLYYGDKLQVISPELKNNYILVKDLADGKIGYVDKDYVVLEGSEEINPEFLCWCQSW